MPHIRFRALQTEHIQSLSSSLPCVLAEAMNTDEDNFTFERVHTEFFAKGVSAESFPFVEILWFERSQDVQDLCAQIITEEVKKLSGAEDVVVIFFALQKSGYYENAKHF